MTFEDYPRFEKMMNHLGNCFDSKNIQQKIPIYFDVLKKYTIAEVDIGIRKSIESCEFFPKPAQIIQQISSKRLKEGRPELNKSCEFCSGTGFTQSFFRLIVEKLKEHPEYAEKTPPITIGLELGIWEPATKSDYDEHTHPRIYSFAVPCQCRKQN